MTQNLLARVNDLNLKAQQKNKERERQLGLISSELNQIEQLANQLKSLGYDDIIFELNEDGTNLSERSLATIAPTIDRIYSEYEQKANHLENLLDALDRGDQETIETLASTDLSTIVIPTSNVSTTTLKKEVESATSDISSLDPDDKEAETKVAKAKPKAKKAAIEKPVAEEPVAEEPVAEEPVAETPILEKPILEEPILEEPVAEEPTATGSPLADLDDLDDFNPLSLLGKKIPKETPKEDLIAAADFDLDFD